MDHNIMYNKITQHTTIQHTTYILTPRRRRRYIIEEEEERRRRRGVRWCWVLVLGKQQQHRKQQTTQETTQETGCNHSFYCYQPARSRSRNKTKQTLGVSLPKLLLTTYLVVG
jgi:hypothetical protein